MFQVLRWGALVFGVFYGFSHQTAISAQDKIAASKHEYERKEKLISQAKAAWAQKNAPKGQSNGCKCHTILSSRVETRKLWEGFIWNQDTATDFKIPQWKTPNGRNKYEMRNMLTFYAQ